MATTTIKMGKRGTIVLPVKLRKQFGLGDGSLLVKNGTEIFRMSCRWVSTLRRSRDWSRTIATDCQRNLNGVRI